MTMMNRTRGLVARMLVAVSLLFGLVVVTGTTADAQIRHRFDRQHRGRVIVRPRVLIRPRVFYPRRYFYGTYPYVSYVPSTHVTEGQGFRDGLNDGQDDAEDNKGYRPSSHNSYKNAVTSAYINGYLRGYEQGYRGIG